MQRLPESFLFKFSLNKYFYRMPTSLVNLFLKEVRIAIAINICSNDKSLLEPKLKVALY